MDQHIDQIAKQTADLRAQSRGLLDEWIRLGEPEQLHKYSDEYLGLKTIAPSQFARLSDLPSRLPPPEPTPPADQPDVVAQSPDSPESDATTADSVATAASPNPAGPAAAESSAPSQAATTDGDQMDEATADDLPVPPIPPATPPVTAVSFPAVTALPLQASPVTPRAATARQEPDAERTLSTAPARTAEEPRIAPAKETPAEPRPGAPGSTPVLTAREPGTTAPAGTRPGWQSRGLPPLQAQGTRGTQGLPPASQGSAPGMAQGPSGARRQPRCPPSSGPDPAAQSPSAQSSAAQSPSRPVSVGAVSVGAAGVSAGRAACGRSARHEPRGRSGPCRRGRRRSRRIRKCPRGRRPRRGRPMDRGPVTQVARQAPMPAQGGSLAGDVAWSRAAPVARAHAGQRNLESVRWPPLARSLRQNHEPFQPTG